MNNSIPERLAALRAVMQKQGIHAYIVPTDDFHASEYVGAHFACRKYITGFTGSAGTAIITLDQAGLWTDGRYFIQAAKQLEGSTITLYKMGEPNVPTTHEWLSQNLADGQCVGYDGRTISVQEAESLAKLLAPKHITFSCEKDCVGEIWKDRPSLSCEPVMELEEKWTGKSRADKIKEVRAVMSKKQADTFLLTCLDDIAWFLNIRGNDIPCCPVVLSYLSVTNDKIILFANKNAFSQEIVDSLQKDGVSIEPYNAIYSYAASLPSGNKVLLCKNKVNSRLVHALPDDAVILNEENPTLLMKAIKTPVEVENEKIAHIKDGVAVTKFMYWLKNQIGKTPITELSAASYLHNLRAEQENFQGDSFAPILSYGPHAAIVHYSPTKESDVPLEAKGLLLADTGGHYLEGTTDITRTIALGACTEEEKMYFTRVLRGTLNLGAAKFLYGCRGFNLDYLARSPLWEIGKDYNHGTGHGVGYLLNVHESPNGFRWRMVPERNDSAIFEEGMITSDEPGFYLEGKFGIRHENMIVCKKAEKNEYGQFMCFEHLTMVPFDLDAVVPELMSDAERNLLNEYHQKVFRVISPYLTEEEKTWLANATREI